MSATQTRGHAGHSHGHGHHHHTDPSLLLSSNKNDAAVRITRLGLYLNLVLAMGKGIAGYYFNSKMLIGDALHSLSDLASDIMTLLTVKWSLKSPSSRYPTGFGKIESLGSLGVSSILLLSGIGIGYSAVMELSQQFFPELAHVLSHFSFLGHSHGHEHGGHDHGMEGAHGGVAPSLNAAWLLVASAGVKEWLVYATRKVARERKSSVLFSNAMHHRADSFTAILTAVVIVASNFIKNAAWLDPVGSLFICGMVTRAGYANLFTSLRELVDVSVDDEIKDSVRRATTKAIDNMGGDQVSIRQVQGMKSGPNYLMELELAVPGNWTVEQTVGVEELVRDRIGAKVKNVKKVRVRFVTSENEGDFMDEFIPSDVSGKSSPDTEHDHDHDHGHEHEHSHGNGNGTGSAANGSAAKRR